MCVLFYVQSRKILEKKNTTKNGCCSCLQTRQSKTLVKQALKKAVIGSVLSRSYQ